MDKAQVIDEMANHDLQMLLHKNIPTLCAVLYHPSSGWVSITFRQDPSHSDDDVTQYMQHGPLQYTASLLSCITFASVHAVCLHLCNLPLSNPTTHRPHHQL